MSVNEWDSVNRTLATLLLLAWLTLIVGAVVEKLRHLRRNSDLAWENAVLRGAIFSLEQDLKVIKRNREIYNAETDALIAQADERITETANRIAERRRQEAATK